MPSNLFKLAWICRRRKNYIPTVILNLKYNRPPMRKWVIFTLCNYQTNDISKKKREKYWNFYMTLYHDKSLAVMYCIYWLCKMNKCNSLVILFVPCDITVINTMVGHRHKACYTIKQPNHFAFRPCMYCSWKFYFYYMALYLYYVGKRRKFLVCSCIISNPVKRGDGCYGETHNTWQQICAL